MFTAALIGADGAGKTTIGKQLERTSSLPIKYIYMGINLESSNVVLPTTRLILELKRLRGRRPDMAAGPPDPTRAKKRPTGMVKRLLAGTKSSGRLLNQVAEEWFRQVLAWYYLRRGFVVLFDRDFYSDYYAHDIANDAPDRPFTSRIHGWVLQHLYSRPKLVICLDAPAEVLYARKPEGTPELLERRRQEYLHLRDQLEHYVVVDASRPAEEVARDVMQVLTTFASTGTDAWRDMSESVSAQ